MELKLQTELGKLTGVFECHQLNCYQEYYVAWFKEYPAVIVEADTVNDAIEELHISLKIMAEFLEQK